LASSLPPPASRGPARRGRVPYVTAPAAAAPAAPAVTVESAAPLATLEGSVERITFANEESGFAVLRLQPTDKSYLVTVVGKVAAVHIGEQVRLHGRWTSHAQHGRQFEAQDFAVVLPTTVEGIRKYLGSGLIRGVGKVTAERLVGHFGADTLAVIEQAPERLEEAGGIGPTRARAIRAAWQEQKAIKEVMVFLASHDVSTTLGLNIYRHYGDESVQVIRETPYKLARDVRGIGFKTADKIAANLGVAPDSIDRAMAALAHLLAQASDEGHVYLPESDLLARGKEMLGQPEERLREALAALADEGAIEIETRIQPTPPAPLPLREGGDDEAGKPLAPPFPQREGGLGGLGPAVYLRPLARAEQGLAGHVRRLLHAGQDRLALWQDVDFARAFAWLAQTTDITLAAAQAEAVRTALTSRVTVLTGGPGTGKTTTVRALLRLLQAKRGTCLLASPTGKAAKRLAEATGAPAKTLHRLLGVGFGGHIGHDAEHPLDADLIVVDEASMLDELLANMLVKAVPSGAHLLFVGDVDQLPSVGPGNVLADLIASEQVAVVRLEVIFRQAAESGIIVNAHRILHGERPELRQYPDFRFVAADEPEQAVAAIRDLVARTLPRQMAGAGGPGPGGAGLPGRRVAESRPGLSLQARDVQVLTPMRVGRLGSANLNEVLQAAVNPPAPEKAERAFGGRVFRVGDRVICVKNDYKRETFNGDGGVVQAVDLNAQQVEVALDDGRAVSYDFADLDELLHAYALSVHRAQGSEYEAVVLALHTQHYVMLQRNLLYTAVSRAKRLVVVVGSPRALAIAIQNDDRAVRYSGLAARLRGLGPPAPRPATRPPDEPDVTVIDDLDTLRAYFAS
jgi:exodeoxyribonuclease V alpha subunit